MEFIFLIFSWIKTLPVDPVFSSLVIVIKKAPITNRLKIQRACRASIFLFETRKLKFFQQSRVFFLMFTCVQYSSNLQLDIFEMLLGMFMITSGFTV